MARYKHVISGVVVEAADDLVLGSEWEAEKATQKRKPAAASSDSKAGE